MKKEIENEINSLLEEISKEVISEFLYEDGKGMLVKFSEEDQFTELIFGTAIFSCNGKQEKIETEKELNHCKLKKRFIKEKINRVQLLERDLLFSFNERNSLLFPHSQSVENWELRWKGKVTITSMPGGEISIF